MKKKFKLTDLDCANCAAKMENAIRKIEGVSDASVSFMTQKMTIQADPERFEEIMAQQEQLKKEVIDVTLEADDARFDAIMEEVVKVCRKVEPDCVINL